MRSKLTVGGLWLLSLLGAYYYGSLSVGREETINTATVKETAQVVEIIERETETTTTQPGDTPQIVVREKETVTRLVTEDSQQRQEKQSTAKVIESRQGLSKYSLEVSYLPSLTELPSLNHTRVEVGTRLGQSPLWATAGFDLKHRQVTVGIRLEF